MAPPSAATRRDRPWLRPSSRRLRNLVSISLRNLSLTPSSPARRRGKTIDDDALPHTLKSPAKLVALREQRTLEHSRSSTDLRSVAEAEAEAEVVKANGSPDDGRGSPKGKVKGADAPRTPPRPPPFARMRRRSTLEWANATPQRRQEKWESVTAERTADVFFSLHVEGVEEPAYVSEMVERTMNPTFRPIDLSDCGPAITRLDRVTLRIWVRGVKTRQWRQLLDISVGLQNLQYLGKSLEHFDQPLPRNTVVFHLTDGVYTSFTSLTDYVPTPSGPITRNGSNRTLLTSSFDALLRLSKLDDSIQDALATRDQLAGDLLSLLQRNQEALAQVSEVAEAQDRLKTIDYAKGTVQKQLDKGRKQQEEKRDSLRNRRRLMAEDLQRRKVEAENMRKLKPELPNSRDELQIKNQVIQSQRRRVCEELQTCYPILPVPKQSLVFTIRSLKLPNCDVLDSQPPEEVAAALGHVAHVVLLLSFYLNRPLPYLVNPKSSTSTIEDPISLMKTNASTTQTYKNEKSLRSYPLFSKGVPRFRFEYAIFLLGKNIQLLLETCYNVRVVDVRQILPNLKYLLYVATAGEGELPARKMGGVKGLLRTKGDGRPGVERAGSDGSNASVGSGFQQRGGGGDGKTRGAVESLRRNIGGGDIRIKK